MLLDGNWVIGLPLGIGLLGACDGADPSVDHAGVVKHVTGCLSERYKDDLVDEIPEVEDSVPGEEYQEAWF